MIGDFFFENLGWVVLAAIISLVALVAVTIAQQQKEREAFMSQCMKERKEYECTAMWRSGDSHTTVMPLPIFVPTR